MRLPWTRRPITVTFSEPPGPPSFEEWEAAILDALDDVPPLPAIDDLPTLSSANSRCPKCRSRCVTIEYHGGRHRECSDARLNNRMESLMFGPPVSARNIAQLRRLNERAVEHHDRACSNCKFRWVEAVA